jgi:hypothetical protein
MKSFLHFFLNPNKKQKRESFEERVTTKKLDEN